MNELLLQGIGAVSTILDRVHARAWISGKGTLDIQTLHQACYRDILSVTHWKVMRLKALFTYIYLVPLYCGEEIFNQMKNHVSNCADVRMPVISWLWQILLQSTSSLGYCCMVVKLSAR